MRIALLIVIIAMSGAFVLLLLLNVLRKLKMDSREKHNLGNRENIRTKIEEFVSGSEQDYQDGLEAFVKAARKKGRNYLAMVDEYLLDTLELPDTKNRGRLISVAERLNFPAECIDQIKSRNPVKSALGSRRAGLYRVNEAVSEMVHALDFLSSENQFEILMGLARIGNAGAMERAFFKISESVIINERAVMEILSSYPDGADKEKLFRYMLHSDTNFLTVLFLKAMGKDLTRTLVNEIKIVLRNKNKEVRAAALRAVATLESDAPAKDLIRSLEDEDWEVRSLAAKALGLVMIPEASAALYRVLFDREWWVRQNAANALINHPGYELLFMEAARSGDKFTHDSIIAALENGGNPILLQSIRNMAV